MQAVAKFKRHSRSLSANSISSMMEKDQERPPAKNPRIDDLLTIPTTGDSVQVINVIDQDHKNYTIDRIKPMVVERRYSRSESPPGDMSSALTSTLSSNSSVHTPH